MPDALEEAIEAQEQLCDELFVKALNALEGTSGRTDVAAIYATLSMSAELRLNGLRQKQIIQQ